MDMEQQAPGTAGEAERDAAAHGAAEHGDAAQEPDAQQKAPRRTARRRSATSPAGAPTSASAVTAPEAPAAPSSLPDAATASDTAAAKPVKASRSRRKPAKDAAQAEAVETMPASSPEAGNGSVATTAEASLTEAAASADLPALAAETGEKQPAKRSRQRASARAAAVKAETRLPEPQGQEEEQHQGDAPSEGSTQAAETPASRAKSSVRARRRASVKAGTDEAPVAPVRTQAPAKGEAPEAEAPKGRRQARAASRPAPEAPATPEAPVSEPLPPAGQTAQDEEAEQSQSPFAALFSDALSPTSMIFKAPDLSAIVRPAPAPEEAEEDEHDEDDDVELTGRRRRRGRGRRSRSARGGESAEDQSEDGDAPEAADEQAGEGEGVTSRRRRRRRRGEVDLELDGGLDDDPPGTVTRVRAPRTPSESTSSRVQSLKGSTRLEAKKQRRRESRESGRRRHVITEAEFLARRESVERQMVVRQKEDRIQIAVLEDGVLAEHFVSKTQQDSLIGNVYLGRVQNVLPSMEAAFVDIGRGRNAVLYAGEVNWEAARLEGAPRRIENALKSGDSVLVQVTKDPVGHKGARLTSQISLPGRYLVYVPGGSMTGISRKLPDVERARLKKILKDHLPEDAGVIVRTAAEGASEEELTHDINRLRAQWESIQSQASSTKVLAPELLYGEPDLTIKVVRDVFNEDFSKLIISGDEAWDTIEAYVTYVAPDLLGRLEKYQGHDDIFAQWRIDEQIHKALDRKVFLPSGGSLVIDRTEAMTVIDVNTGKFTGSGGNLEETVTKNNLEAAEEIVRQLRLRDVGGIIVIDFIDMVLESNRDLVLRRLVECLGRDRTKHQVAEVTSLGLVQMTRKRMGTGLLEVFSETCEVCAGRGVITHDEPVERGGTRGPAAPAVEQQPRTDSAASGGRKRRRRGNGQPAEASAPAAPAPAPEDPDRQAKAQATRAALAAVAAAAHAAHAHDGEAPAAKAPAVPGEALAGSAGAVSVPAPTTATERRPQHEGGSSEGASVAAAVAAASPAAQAEAAHAPMAGSEQRDGAAPAILTIGGERIEIPQGDAPHEAPAPEPVLSLDALSHAFDELTGERHTPGEAEARPGRRRRGRGARSGQGSAEVTRVDASGGAVGGQTRSVSTPAPQRDRQTPPDDGGPLILGVGVPASEL